MQVRLAHLGDADDLCRIYNHEVLKSTATLDLVPRSLTEQQQYLVDRSGGLIVVVAEEGGDVIGFGSISFYRNRPGYRTSVEDSVYVDRAHAGKGVGSIILAELVAVATTRGFHAMFARIVGPQQASVRLHERHGFTMVGVEREVGRKFNRWHDVGLMQRLL
ncbi:MAG: N-acetyltransferase family protein [Actinomycetota bacterium]